MTDPVVCPEGHSFERASIESWLELHESNPLTRNPLTRDMLRPNNALRDAIRAWTCLATKQQQQAASGAQPLPPHPRELGPAQAPKHRGSYAQAPKHRGSYAQAPKHRGYYAQAPKHRGYYFDQFGMRQWVDPQRRRDAGAATRPRCKTYGFPCPSCAQDVALEQGAPCVACAPPELLCVCQKEAKGSVPCWRCAQDARAIARSDRVQTFQGYGYPVGEGRSNHEAWLCHACGYHIVFQANCDATQRTILRMYATEAHELICPLLATGEMSIG